MIAERQVNFEPERTQIRMLRQGLNSKPYWIVSLSVPGAREGTFRRLATVQIERQHRQARRKSTGISELWAQAAARSSLRLLPAATRA